MLSVFGWRCILLRGRWLCATYLRRILYLVGHVETMQMGLLRVERLGKLGSCRRAQLLREIRTCCRSQTCRGPRLLVSSSSKRRRTLRLVTRAGTMRLRTPRVECVGRP